MIKLNDKRFADYFRTQPETGMDYFVTTVHLKTGQSFHQVVVSGGMVTRVRGYHEIPFSEADIERFEVTHDKWDWKKAI